MQTTVQKRHDAIRRIILAQPVASQEALGQLLAAEGIPSTQATLSRDLNALGVSKVPTATGFRYALIDGAGVASIPPSMETRVAALAAELADLRAIVAALVVSE